MNSDLSESAEEQFTDLLAALDEDLASSSSAASGGDRTPPPGLRPRLERGRACIQLLREILPRRSASAPPAHTSGAAVPDRIGPFEIVRELGRGAFGIVFLAKDPYLKRTVALKVPRAEALADPQI